MGIVFGRISEEIPRYVVVHKTPIYEVWRYSEVSIAAVVHASDLKDPTTHEIPNESRFTGMAFNILARYIGVFGTPENKMSSNSTDGSISNQSVAIAMTAPVVMDPPIHTKIAMTAPVIMDPPSDGGDSKKIFSDADGSTMKFLLPSKYNRIEDVPTPTNPAVKLELIPSGRCEAVHTFTGNFNMKRASQEAEKFMAVLREDSEKIKIIGDWTAQGYNPPFTIPFLKRNEIHVPVSPQPFESIESLS
jgi:SOUL heme-binding protein